MKSQRNSKWNRNGRWSDKPKREHGIILEALKVANLAEQKPVRVRDIISALMPDDEKTLKKFYESKSLNSIVTGIIGLLVKRNLVVNVGKTGRWNCYVAKGVDLPNETDKFNLKSRRQQVLELIKLAVRENGRGLKMGEIQYFAKGHIAFSHLSDEEISRDALSLKQTGELIAISIRGDRDGFYLYIPASFNKKDYLPEQPITWMEFVLAKFNEIWEEHKIRAVSENTKPFPILTGEVRAKIAESGKYEEKLKNPKTLIAAMQQLARTSNKSIRRIKRSKRKAVFWVPNGVVNEDINLSEAYANDSERIWEAVNRCVLKLDRPVNVFEIEEENRIDPSLETESEKNIHILLSDATRNKTSRKKGLRWKRLYKVGTIAGRSYFHINNEKRITAYVDFKNISNRWKNLNTLKTISEIENASLETVAYGRLKMIAEKLRKTYSELISLKSIHQIQGVTQDEVVSLIKELEEIQARLKTHFDSIKLSIEDLPEEIENKPQGLVVGELKSYLSNYYPKAASIKGEKGLRGLLKNTIRKYTNPDFIRTNYNDPQKAAKYLYDKTSMFFRIANQWGGVESRLQAGLAYKELGELRDYRFVEPSLSDKDFNKRLTAVACVAFLASNECKNKLMDMAECDPEYGVRQSCLWAYGLIEEMSQKSIKWIFQRSHQDKDERVRNFATKLLETEKGKWLLN